MRAGSTAGYGRILKLPGESDADSGAPLVGPFDGRDQGRQRGLSQGEYERMERRRSVGIALFADAIDEGRNDG